LSTEHWKVDGPSLEEKPKVGVLLLIVEPSLGPEVIVVSGAAVSTVKLRVAVAVLPAASVARTRKVYEPSGSGEGGVWEVAVEQVPKLVVP
jgi:hypothetical protein